MEDSSYNSRTSLLSKYWTICESAQQSSVKLVLTTDNEIPFYLVRTNKCNKNSTGKWRNITASDLDTATSAETNVKLKLKSSLRKMKMLIPIPPRLQGRDLYVI